MKARDLKPGDVFKVPSNPDPEGPYRVCLTNNSSDGIRFGFPGNKAFWCFMGENVEVEVIMSLPEHK